MNINSTRNIVRPILLATLCLLFATLTNISFGQTGDSVEQLKAEQQQLSERFKQLQAKLFSLSKFEESSNPARAKLLRKAFKQSQERLTNVQLSRAVSLINDGKYKDAEGMQNEALTSLAEMLKLLQSEDGSQQRRDEIDKVKEYLKEVARIERVQKGTRGQADAGLDMDRVAKSQESAEKRTGDLLDKMQSDDKAAKAEAKADAEAAAGSDSEGEPSEGEPSEGSPSEGEPSEGQPSEGQPSEGQPSEGQPSEGSPSEGSPSEGSPSEGSPSEGSPSEGSPSEGSPSEGSPSEGSPSEGSPSEGSPSEGQPSEGSPSEGSPSEGSPSEGSPSEGEPSEGSESEDSETEDSVQDKIAEAQERMKEATEALKDAERDNATDLMEKAEKKLAEAKKELEEILRQLREEENDSNLKKLEERFRTMLEQQIRVNEATDKLAVTPNEARTTEFEIKANRLAGDQNEIVTSAGRALLLLKEDGSSIAFPVTVEEMQQDMMQVSSRLSAAKVNPITQEIEADIVATLNELIEALVKAQEDNEESEEQPEGEPPEGEGSPPGEEPLVDQIAELKMLKSLQTRIYTRHQRYAKYLPDPKDPVGVSQEPDVVAALDRLAGRQSQLADIARQLVNEQNE